MSTYAILVTLVTLPSMSMLLFKYPTVLSTINRMSKKQRLSTVADIELAIYNDLRFPKTDPSADYSSNWTPTSTASDLYKILATWESAVLFAAREGWVTSTAPVCSRDHCKSNKTKGYLYKRKPSNYVWRFSCCGSMVTILKDTMFYKSVYGPRKLLELMWMISMRVPINMISQTVFGRLTSEVYA